MTILLIILTLILIGSTLHYTYFKGKLNNINPFGTLLDIDNGKIHIHSMGSGEQVIVLLPGMGIPLPSADFGPLMRKLSNKYTVVSIEYFGVGFSSGTNKPRTCENYVEEIRLALNKSGFKGPYILMPHSISNIYSEYYASKYPNEVAGIISLDGTSTAFYMKAPSFIKYLLPIIKLQQFTGITSIIGVLGANKKKLIEMGYSEKEISAMSLFAGFSINDTLLNQILNSTETVKEAMDMPYPESVPYFKVISKDTYTRTNKQLKMTPEEYQLQHLARIGSAGKYEILEGSHFIYLNNIDKIAEITDNFI